MEGLKGPAETDAWRTVLASRLPTRPGLRDLLQVADEGHVRWSGTHAGERSDSITVSLATFGRTPVIVTGQDRLSQRAGRLIDPAALRVARRGISLAERLGLPLVTVIDTPGAELSVSAEEGAIASEIGRCLSDMVSLTVPSVAVLLGEGCGGGALALFPARRVVAAQNSWLAPLAPEGASAILFRSVDRAAEMARRQHIRSTDLLARGAVHAVVAEDPPAHRAPAEFCRAVVAEVERQLALQG